jgi:hypothetical protein
MIEIAIQDKVTSSDSMASSIGLTTSEEHGEFLAAADPRVLLPSKMD